jgi:drug/metabolite transporter (DMT)-like permease
MLKWVLIVCTVFASSAGDILCAKGMSEGRELNVLRPAGILRAVEYILTRKLVILGYLCYAAAFFSLMGLLSVAQLTVAIPATAFTFVIDTLGARFILHERIPWMRWIGVICVSAGVILVIRPGPSAAPPSARPARPGCITVQACQDQAGHNHGRPQRLHK